MLINTNDIASISTLILKPEQINHSNHVIKAGIIMRYERQ